MTEMKEVAERRCPAILYAVRHNVSSSEWRRTLGPEPHERPARATGHGQRPTTARSRPGSRRAGRALFTPLGELGLRPVKRITQTRPRHALDEDVAAFVTRQCHLPQQRPRLDELHTRGAEHALTWRAGGGSKKITSALGDGRRARSPCP